MRHAEAVHIADAAAAAAFGIVNTRAKPKAKKAAWWIPQGARVKSGVVAIAPGGPVAQLFDYVVKRGYKAEANYRQMCSWCAVEQQWSTAPEAVRAGFQAFTVTAMGLKTHIEPEPEPAPEKPRKTNPKRGVEKADEDDSLKGRVSGSAKKRSAATKAAAKPAAKATPKPAAKAK